MQVLSPLLQVEETESIFQQIASLYSRSLADAFSRLTFQVLQLDPPPPPPLSLYHMQMLEAMQYLVCMLCNLLCSTVFEWKTCKAGMHAFHQKHATCNAPASTTSSTCSSRG